MEKAFSTHLSTTSDTTMFFRQVLLNPVLSVDKMQLRNKYRGLEGVKEEGVLIVGCEEIYSF